MGKKRENKYGENLTKRKKSEMVKDLIFIFLYVFFNCAISHVYHVTDIAPKFMGTKCESTVVVYFQISSCTVII